ncbi:unnamed protein product [Prorocentrum cordatum]|uniref:Altered inheritance of mitochondria protein 24, mitochondrial n=1 Tax=Prorocentrum cordatum TaxID=2364126 RepID=A0ABN9X618_9DINO|nr:unnamed protein product [Polarella glacialis]
MWSCRRLHSPFVGPHRPMARASGVGSLMRNDLSVKDRCPSQADGARLVVKNSFFELVDAASGLRRSKSDGHLACTIGGCLVQMDAAQVAPSDAMEGLTRMAGCLHVSATTDATTHHSFSDSASVASGSRCSWAEISDCSQYHIGGCFGFSDDSQDEYHDTSSLVPPTNHSSSSGEAYELVEQREWWISKGSVHAAGTCRPCVKVFDLPRKAKARNRPSKTARLHCKQLVAAMDGARGSDLHAALGLPSGGERQALAGQGVRIQDQEYVLRVFRARQREQQAP